ncbi:outer membrane protein transport protein, partial [Alloalcanivorax mobilis]|uniref:outer membrane protein transport protein n=1 Tax=Alloalcanivorax mobilis TaxID=2019569 RepID=UPI001E4B1019
LEYQLTDMVGVTAGVAFEESPLDSTDNPNVNYLDADRTVFGLGLTSTFDHVYGMRYPVRVDVGYQYHLLDKREFHVTSDQTGNDDYVETDGEINVFGGSISMKF